MNPADCMARNAVTDSCVTEEVALAGHLALTDFVSDDGGNAFDWFDGGGVARSKRHSWSRTAMLAHAQVTDLRARGANGKWGARSSTDTTAASTATR